MVSSMSAQTGNKGADQCSQKKMSFTEKMLLLEQDSPNTPKHKFDVLNYKINIDIRSCFLSPYPKSFNGSVEVRFRIDTALNVITLNAVNTSITVSSVGLAGVSFTHASNLLNITLDRIYNPGEIATVRVNYSHANVSDQAFYASNGMVFTDCEPEGARKWFPCYDKPSDKATVDLTAKVPANAKLGSNGRLADSLLTGDSLYYHWVSRDPVATYLVVMSGKVNYNLDIVYWRKLSNPNDSVPIRFYYNSGENPSTMKTKIIPMTTYYSQKFGEHPFEKNGFATLNNQFTWGGMENQTLTSLCPNCWSENLISHEFAHQWFGDMITCGTWADIWLNEGFATYCEALWLESTSGYSAYKSDILGDASGYLSSNPGWAMYNPDWIINTPPTNTLFNTAITYYKGACVLHMLRYTIGDTLFFNALKSYATDSLGGFKYNSSVTDDFASKVSQVAGQDMSWFINQWVKEPNHPVYQNYYNFADLGTGQWRVNFTARQVQTNSAFHKMPIVLKIAFTSGTDSLIRVMNDANNQQFSFTFNRQPSSLAFDPNNDIVLKQASLILGIEDENFATADYQLNQNYPNPFNPVTKISYVLPKESDVKLKIFDLQGKEVTTLVNEKQKSGNYEVDFNAANLPSGVYIYKLTAGNFQSMRKLTLLK
jgi:aminopeptidase N